MHNLGFITNHIIIIKMKDTIVLYPALGRGHLLSMVELGKLIATNHPSFSITILILTPPTTTATICTATQQYMSAITAATPSITFHLLPPPSPPPPSLAAIPPQILTVELSRLSNHHFHQALASISKTSNINAIIMDFMNYHPNTNIPTYLYFTSGASALAVLIHFPAIHESTTKSFKNTHIPLRIPGLPTIYTDDLPDVVNERENRAYNMFLETAKTLRGSVGIIVNTFEAIEERAIRALREGYTTSAIIPKVFCIGPVISDPCDEGDETGCLSWLDSQPSQSVVLLSFGSLGRFSKAQLKEIAVGLEKSEQRFLWVVRAESDAGDGDSELSLDELLPEGFVERTKEKGMVVRNWAPQAAILSHDSVGGFVTHCGWNSVLEAVCEGVPMVVWPLYAEQRLNRVIMVNEMRVALGLNESKEGLVSGAELGERVKELMDSDRGKEIRQRIFKMKMGAKEARAEGGSSIIDLNKLVQSWKSS